MSFLRNIFGRREERLPQQANGHELIIGPLCDDPLFSRKARLYFCMRCKQRYLVCGDRYALLDKRGNVTAALAAQDRAESLEQAICPARDLKEPKQRVKAFVVPLRRLRKLREPRKLAEPIEPPALRRVDARQ